MPFILTNAPATFQRCTNELFKHLPFVAVYLDDILVFSRTPEEHLRHLESVLEIPKADSLYCKLKKDGCNKPNLRVVGHVVGATHSHILTTAALSKTPACMLGQRSLMHPDAILRGARKIANTFRSATSC